MCNIIYFVVIVIYKVPRRIILFTYLENLISYSTQGLKAVRFFDVLVLYIQVYNLTSSTTYDGPITFYLDYFNRLLCWKTLNIFQI